MPPFGLSNRNTKWQMHTIVQSLKQITDGQMDNMPLLLRPKEQKNRSLIYAVASPVPSPSLVPSNATRPTWNFGKGKQKSENKAFCSLYLFETNK